MIRAEVAHFSTFGFVVLRDAIDGAKLRAEVVASLPTAPPANLGVATAQYVPIMKEPESLTLLDRFEPFARALCGGDVCPLRAKGVRYFGETGWHVDSTHTTKSVGFLAYLDDLEATTGALRVLPGSHRSDYSAAIDALVQSGPRDVDALPGVPLATRCGDVIVFDEHLWHASARGDVRLQWRVDYVRIPTTTEERAALATYLDETFPPDWDGGYDTEASPSYGPEWLSSGRRAVGTLRDLGVYERAEKQEAFMREASRSTANGRR